MSENILEIKLKALSPISVTKRVFGILYETYHFIPAWTIWNAFVKLYALKHAEDEKINYERAKELFKSVRLTNFYIHESGNLKIKIQEAERRKYISSDMKNAINTLTNTSLEGALYEREYIKTKTFVGWVKTNNQDICNFLKGLKSQTFFIGADKNTGFGKVMVKEIIDNEDNFLNTASANEIIDKIKSPVSSNYLIGAETKDEKLFPFVLREVGEKGSGMDIKYIGN